MKQNVVSTTNTLATVLRISY